MIPPTYTHTFFCKKSKYCFLFFCFLTLDCPPGWDEFENSCYKVMTSFLYSRGLSWENARAVCLGFEGDLVSIKNKREMEFIEYLTSNLKDELLWIGLNDRLKEDQFVWSDGTPFDSSVYSSWPDGEPNNSGNEDCVEMRSSRWNDRSCSVTHFYICERPKGRIILSVVLIYTSFILEAAGHERIEFIS